MIEWALTGILFLVLLLITSSLVTGWPFGGSIGWIK